MAIKIGNVVQAKAGTVSFANATAKALFTLPANAMVIRITALGVIASGGTSGTYTVRSQPTNGASAAAALGVIDAYEATIATIPAQASLAGIAMTRVSESQYITVTYVDGVGTASAGNVTLVVEYL